jgi:hypothetical protein
MRNFMTPLLTLGLVVAAVALSQVPVAATASQDVPEISGSALSAGMGLLAAGVLILRARRRSK